mmetsp:Transcript_33509/g.94253  ORF Transcript_33509/g.94253 Transcript_33509/m.94253 type:complete len:226 (+) Transcript_33509:3219-3896(+)
MYSPLKKNSYPVFSSSRLLHLLTLKSSLRLGACPGNVTFLTTLVAVAASTTNCRAAAVARHMAGLLAAIANLLSPSHATGGGATGGGAPTAKVSVVVLHAILHAVLLLHSSAGSHGLVTPPAVLVLRTISRKVARLLAVVAPFCVRTRKVGGGRIVRVIGTQTGRVASPFTRVALHAYVLRAWAHRHEVPEAVAVVTHFIGSLGRCTPYGAVAITTAACTRITLL